MMAAAAMVPSRIRIDAPDIGTTDLESWSESARSRTRSGWTDNRAVLLIRPTMPVPPSERFLSMDQGSRLRILDCDTNGGAALSRP
jgi:hypothetical protein